MIALIQRVRRAHVTVGDREAGRIGAGMLALVGVAASDGPEQARRLVDRLLSYRIFADEVGNMNLNLAQIGGGLLLVPQFTLVADTHKGTRPGFSRGAPPDQARALFESLAAAARATHPVVATGVFGADMQVALVNDGPVTIWMDSKVKE